MSLISIQGETGKIVILACEILHITHTATRIRVELKGDNGNINIPTTPNKIVPIFDKAVMDWSKAICS